MVPFMYYHLKDIVYQLLEVIAKPAFLDSFKAKSQTWKDIDLPKDSNMLESWISGLPLIKLSVILRKTIQQMPIKTSNFGSEAKCFIVSMVSKFFKWIPLGSALLNSASMLDPDVLQGNSEVI